MDMRWSRRTENVFLAACLVEDGTIAMRFTWDRDAGTLHAPSGSLDYRRVTTSLYMPDCALG